MSASLLSWLVPEIAILGIAAWLIDRFGGRRLGGRGLKALWLAFFAKLALPFGLLALVPLPLPPVSLPSSNVWEPAPFPQGTPQAVPAPHPLPAGVEASGLSVSWEGLGLALLLVPAVVLLLLLLVRVIQARTALSTLPEIGGALKLRTDTLARGLGIRRPIRLLRSAAGSSPASWDLFQPAILVPQGWEEQSPDAEQEQILLHELVHLKNRDPLIGLAAQLLTCVYWFHPLVWIARNRLMSSLESACDQQVLSLSAGNSRSVYSRALFRAIALAPNGSLLPGTQAAAADKNALKRRILMIQEFHPRRGNGVALAVLGLVFLVTVSLVPAGAAPETPATLVDDIHRPFVDDGSVQGRWKVVDFVDTPSDYVHGKTSSTVPLYLKALIFYNGGKMGAETTDALPAGPLPGLSWTRGVVMHQSDVTASAYTIEWRWFFTDVMFFEWKSGDYTIRHMKPKYYVLVRG